MFAAGACCCGVALTAPLAKPVEAAARDAGFLVNAAAPDVVRLAPPLIITEAQIDEFLTHCRRARQCLDDRCAERAA